MKSWPRATEAVSQWQEETGLDPWKVEGFAKREDVGLGEGIRFAKQALSLALPSGAPFTAIAGTDRHVRAYKALSVTRIDNSKAMLGFAPASQTVRPMIRFRPQEGRS